MKAYDKVYIETGAEEEDITHSIHKNNIVHLEEYKQIQAQSRKRFEAQMQVVQEKARENKRARLA